MAMVSVCPEGLSGIGIGVVEGDEGRRTSEAAQRPSRSEANSDETERATEC